MAWVEAVRDCWPGQHFLNCAAMRGSAPFWPAIKNNKRHMKKKNFIIWTIICTILKITRTEDSFFYFKTSVKTKEWGSHHFISTTLPSPSFLALELEVEESRKKVAHYFMKLLTFESSNMKQTFNSGKFRENQELFRILWSLPLYTICHTHKFAIDELKSRLDILWKWDGGYWITPKSKQNTFF